MGQGRPVQPPRAVVPQRAAHRRAAARRGPGRHGQPAERGPWAAGALARAVGRHACPCSRAWPGNLAMRRACGQRQARQARKCPLGGGCGRPRGVAADSRRGARLARALPSSRRLTRRPSRRGRETAWAAAGRKRRPQESRRGSGRGFGQDSRRAQRGESCGAGGGGGGTGRVCGCASRGRGGRAEGVAPCWQQRLQHLRSAPLSQQCSLIHSLALYPC